MHPMANSKSPTFWYFLRVATKTMKPPIKTQMRLPYLHYMPSEQFLNPSLPGYA